MSPLVLGIESSCDETGVGIVSGTTLLADAVASSVPEQVRFGGVVPEVASRAHVEAMVPTLQRACAEAGVELRDVDAIAVTAGPGLAGALVVGVAAAKALALALDKPLYGVNHLAPTSPWTSCSTGRCRSGCVALLASGGHSSILRVIDVTADVEPLGATIDDAAGEAFDKVARMLGLGFPGGPAIDLAARDGRPGGDRLPARADRPARRALRLLVLGAEDRGQTLAGGQSAGQCARRGRLVPGGRGRRAECQGGGGLPRTSGVDTLVLGGGVAANSRLRALTEQRCTTAGVRLRVPRPALCTDNGAMVAALGAEMVARGRPPSGWLLGADSSLPVVEPLVP